MTFNYELINKVLEAIFPLPDEFGMITINDGYDQEEPIDYDYIYDSVIKIDKDAEINYGMSKLVICSPNFGGVVIKIPFNGYLIRDYDDNECEQDSWYDFYGADGSDPSDYCLTEYEKYQQLKKVGLQCFVTKTIFFKTICGVRVFLQEEVIAENDDYEMRSASQKSQKLARDWWAQGILHISFEWIANCLDKYGESKTKKFLDYCNKVDLSILGDTHCGNYGYRKNGTPCLLDFSDYND